MALIKLSREIVSIRGRFGGVYFKSGPDGQHVQAMPRFVKYPRVGVQGDYVSKFTGVAAIWLLALLGAFGAAWAAYALVYWFIGEKGERKRLTGYNWYIHYALMFPEADPLPFWKPPHSPGDLPNYVCTYRGRWMYERVPADWGADCPAGYFWEGIPWNGKPSYKTDNYEWHIWWKDPEWIVSTGPGFEPVGKTFDGDDGTIGGYYQNRVTKLYAHVYIGRPE